MGALRELFRGTNFMFPKKKYAIDYQRDAKKALKGRWSIAIVAALIVSLLGAGGSSVSFNFNMGDSDMAIEENFEENAEENLEEIEVSEEEIIGYAVGIMLSFAVVFAGVLVVSALVTGPVRAGYERFNLDLFKGKTAKIETLFSYFKQKRYGKSVGLYIRYTLVMILYALPMFISFLFAMAGSISVALYNTQSNVDQSVASGLIALTLIASGVTVLFAIWLIVNSYKYCMSFKIFVEHPTMSAREAMKESKKLMKGNKKAMFCLHCSFIGWIFLALLTCGIGFIWLNPFMQAADAAFYRNVSMRRKLGLS